MIHKSLTTTLNHHIAVLQNVNHNIISFHSYPRVNSQQLTLNRTQTINMVVCNCTAHHGELGYSPRELNKRLLAFGELGASWRRAKLGALGLFDIFHPKTPFV